MIIYTPLSRTLKEKSISIEELATMVKTNKTLKTYLNQGKYLSLETVDEICSLLKVDISNVIAYKDGEQIGGNRVKVNWNILITKLSDNGYGLTTISSLLHLDRTYLSHAKKRNSTIPYDLLIRIGKELNCNPDELKYTPEIEE